MPTEVRPTEAEHQLLKILWKLGPSTVREVHRELEDQRDSEVAYTTVLKMLQIMNEKGLVHRDESQRSHIYTPVHSEGEVQGRLVADLLDRAFGGSATRLVMRALAERPADPEELDQIRKLIDAHAAAQTADEEE
jgi:BlaI family penicillinase repressor